MPDPRFQLHDEPCVPVQWTTEALAAHPGLPASVTLSQVLARSHEIAALAVPDPPAYAALLRILYALTARVTALDESCPGDWARRRLRILDDGTLPQDGIEDYFATWGHRFRLFDPEGGRPWMQDPRLARQCDPLRSAGVNKLSMTRCSGNNHAWWSHTQDGTPDPLPAGRAFLDMLTWHYYGAAGRGSARKVGGESSSTMKAGPLRTALSYHPEGSTLFETLLAGLMKPETVVRRETDLCPWEWAELPDPEADPPPVTGPCSRLTAVSQHAVLLIPDPGDSSHVADAFITWAYRTGRIPRTDPYLIWQVSQQGNVYPRPADATRGLWRDLDALLLAEAGGPAQPRRPPVFTTALEFADALEMPLAVRALGFDQEGQAKDRQFVTGITPPVLAHAETDNAGTAPAAGRLRVLGEMYGRRLDRAVRRAHALYSDDKKAKEAASWAERAAAMYWPRAQDEFWARFRGLDRSGALLVEAGLDRAAARRAFLRLAEEAYATVTAPVSHTPRGAKAATQARIELYGGHRRPTR
ncbi:type I-E CRISPR-associated protein Cse1/CasA [Streptomyces sp. NPDC047014]|uniref:type I-E CRISPR-associated protein Cse1/CasA n=1 Tax=Streptomyces sp. NPDC047014 TaxID=3155736 RepID=UPI0033E30A36